MGMDRYYSPQVSVYKFNNEKVEITTFEVKITHAIIEVEMKITWLDRIRLLFKGCR